MTFKIGDLIKARPHMFRGGARKLRLYKDKNLLVHCDEYAQQLGTSIGEVVDFYNMPAPHTIVYPVIWWPQLGGYDTWHKDNLIFANDQDNK